jgi:uncharacterized membrane-anchored protein YitT (DUF2179 family)
LRQSITIPASATSPPGRDDEPDFLAYSALMKSIDDRAPKHSLGEDIFAIFTGALFISFGIVLFKKSGLLTGGTSGAAFLAYYLASIPFGLAFFVINIPFYALAILRMGWRFTVKTFCAVALVSLMSETHGYFIEVSKLQPLYAAIIGGLLLGMGFLILFRHQASLGGINILALYLQDKLKIPAGKLQLGVDIAVLIVALFAVDWRLVLASIVASFAMNGMIWVNHRKDRYVAWSAA